MSFSGSYVCQTGSSWGGTVVWVVVGKSLHAMIFNETCWRRCRRATIEQPKRKAEGSVRATRTFSVRAGVCGDIDEEVKCGVGVAVGLFTSRC